jgi:sensor histidine kinase regulating citrate/malate metabolism
VSRQGLGVVNPDSAPPATPGQAMSMSLLVVKRTIERCGGAVDFSSSHGRGISFSVILPVRPAST